MTKILLALGLLACLAGSGHAQSAADIDKLDAAMVEAWAAAPLSVRHAAFVSGSPDGFGQYVERPNNVFKPGEKLIAYAEPAAYGWKDAGNGQYEFGFAVDFVLKSPSGDILAGKQDFAKLVEKSHARNREFMVVLTLNVTGAPPGDYVLQYTLRDVAGPKTVSFDLPFKIAK
jgi:hypothetical protein